MRGTAAGVWNAGDARPRKGRTVMLFEKKIDPRCAYCQRGTPLDGEQVACVKKGIVSPSGSCRRFRYDPLKRTPPKPMAADFDRFKDEDFTL